jgi:hypothetical protein
VAYANFFKVDVENTLLTQAKQAFDEIKVCGMYFTGNPERAFTLVRFFGQQVATGGFPVGDLTGTGNLESFLCPGMGFNLRHDCIFSVYPAGVPEQTGRLWDRLG